MLINNNQFDEKNTIILTMNSKSMLIDNCYIMNNKILFIIL